MMLNFIRENIIDLVEVLAYGINKAIDEDSTYSRSFHYDLAPLVLGRPIRQTRLAPRDTVVKVKQSSTPSTHHLTFKPNNDDDYHKRQSVTLMHNSVL